MARCLTLFFSIICSLEIILKRYFSYISVFFFEQGRCNREKPPCKYFHPPQHLKDQLLINGRNHLALKNAIMQQLPLQPLLQPPTAQLAPAVVSIMNVRTTLFSSYPFNPSGMPSASLGKYILKTYMLPNTHIGF